MAADLLHDLNELCGMVATFPGIYQMMPAPYAPLPDLDLLYRAYTYGGERKVPQRHLDAARQFHQDLKDVVDPERMVYVAGYNRPTLLGIEGMRVADPRAYGATRAGDGRVAHVLGLLPGVRTYYVDESHDALPLNSKVLAATTSLLETGETTTLPATMPPITRALAVAVDSRNVPGSDESEVARVRECAKELQMLRGLEASAPISAAEHDATELLLRGWLSGGLEAGAAPLPTMQPAAPAAVESSRLEAALKTAVRVKDLGQPGAPVPDTAPHHLRISIARRGIQDAHELDRTVDAIAVGHYVGVTPQNAELALDRAISGRLARMEPSDVPPDKLVLTQYTQRGTIRGELGQMFVLPDPRNQDVVVVVAGMGVPGRFGAPEAAVLARELVWSLARLGKKHLAMVLIGSGAGNLQPEEAVDALLRGVAEATAGEVAAGGTRLERLTILEWDEGRTVELDGILAQACANPRKRPGLEIEYEPLPTAVREKLKNSAAEKAAAEARQEVLDGGKRRPAGRIPTRLTVALDRRGGRAVYRLGAITSDAPVPEREVVLDESLVTEANDLLPGLTKIAEQARQGRFLERLLLSDMRDALATEAPLVMLVDAATARIHWEMVAQPNAGGVGGPPVADGFLATKRSLTRQLRTTFAPIPEPPPPTHRPISVLIVADPAGDNPLPGAAREGFEIFDLFQRFKQVYPRASRGVEVKLLTGPVQASRNAVLGELFSRPYDVLHFAGHCTFDQEDPAASGWIFDGGARLSAYELSRVDRVPKFVFSNACESGITPDRADRRNAALAPSFAEAFFQRGVANFVCTAWPVGDDAALNFALHVYSALLGLGTEQDPSASSARPPLEMHAAMLEARQALLPTSAEADEGPDVPFWGAYQHYGNPDFRLFARDDLQPPRAAAAGAAGARGRKGKKAQAATAKRATRKSTRSAAAARPPRRGAAKAVTVPAGGEAPSRPGRTRRSAKAPPEKGSGT